MYGFFQAGYKEQGDVEKYLSEISDFRVSGYGGNTMCVQVKTDKQELIIDGGSGIRPLSHEVISGPAGHGKGEVHILFTHFHWDHLIGLPFFVPIYIPGNVIHCYAVQPELSDAFRVMFRKPYFPVDLKDLGARIEYHVLEPRKTVMFKDIAVTPYQLDHPDPCWGYTFEHGGKKYSHCVDTEATRVSRDELGPDLPLYQNVDLLAFDAQYTIFESIERFNWGHASASLGIDIALRKKVKKILFMHNDPDSSDYKIAAAESECRRYYQSQLRALKMLGQTPQEVEWCFVAEDSVFEV